MTIAEKDIERFWSKVDTSGDCWLWKAGKDKDGYGWFSIGHVSRLAHRVSWEIHHGPIPSGMAVLHKCDTPPCVRVEHFFLGTNLENVADRHAKGRDASGDRNGARIHPEIRRGERNGRAKLTEQKVMEIRQRSGNGENYKKLAAEFNVTSGLIGHIVRKRLWKEVPMLNNSGQSLVEYTLLVLLIAFVFWIAIKNTQVGDQLSTSWSNIQTCLAKPTDCTKP